MSAAVMGPLSDESMLTSSAPLRHHDGERDESRLQNEQETETTEQDTATEPNHTNEENRATSDGVSYLQDVRATTNGHTSSPSSCSRRSPTNGTTSSASPKKTRVCEFYIQPRGCKKGDECDFIHPRAPNGDATHRVCSFYAAGGSCKLGNECNFLHVIPPSRASVHSAYHHHHHPPPPSDPYSHAAAAYPSYASRAPSAYGHDGAAAWAAHPSTVSAVPPATSAALPGARPCAYYFSPRGCVKGEACDFSHSTPPLPRPPPPAMPHLSYAPSHYPPGAMSMSMSMGGRGGYGGAWRNYPSVVPKKPKICEYWSSPAGCKKGENCDFIHVRQQVCTYWTTSRGCKKGEYCDHLHPAGANGSSSPSTSRFEPSSSSAPSSSSSPSRPPAVNGRDHSSSSRYRPY